MDWVHAYTAGRTPWDLAMVSPPLRTLLRENRPRSWGVPENGRVAVPGCGRGHDLRAWAAAGYDVTGFDLVPAVVREARMLLRLNRAAGEVHVRDVLGLAQEFGASFDLVYDYACFCALPRYLRESYLDEVAAILAPGGVYLLLAFPWIGDGPNAWQADGRVPHPVSEADLAAVVEGRFECIEDFDAQPSVPDRAELERWFAWRRSPAGLVEGPQPPVKPR